MFNFFKRNNHQDQNDDVSITYSVGDDKELKVDIAIPTYDQVSLGKLAYLIHTVKSDSCFMETVEMIKGNLKEANEEELLLEFILTITAMAGLATKPNDDSNKPCIQPSDMLQ